MSILDYYIPSESGYILRLTPSHVFFVYLEFYFHIELDDNHFYLVLTNKGTKELIPDDILQKVIDSATRNSKTTLYSFYHSILPLKEKLINGALENNCVRLDKFLFNGSGYAEKKDGIVMFFDAKTLMINRLSKSPSFIVTKKAYKKADNSYIATGDDGHTSFFIYYPDGDFILRFDTLYLDNTFIIEKISRCSTMQYLQMYKNNRNALDIYKAHTDGSNRMLRKLFK